MTSVRDQHITASLNTGFCGQIRVAISRLPVGTQDTSSASSLDVLLRVIHAPTATGQLVGNRLETSSHERTTLPTSPFQHIRSSSLGVPISRVTLITLLLISNSRPTFQYADASGYRSNFAGYFGQWYINWGRGEQATVTLRPHDSHKLSTDVYPPMLVLSVKSCINMMAGVVIKASSPRNFNVAFPGRMTPGAYILKFQPRGYAGSHGSRHIYNMSGGAVYEIDFLLMKRLLNTKAYDAQANQTITLTLPSSDEAGEVSLCVEAGEQDLLAKALDNLPWSSLSWSLHRGLRDLLLAFAKPTMDEYRQALAERLATTAEENVDLIASKGWNHDFVKQHMAAMARSCILAGRGNSGDMIRIVTFLAELCCTTPSESIGDTKFWTKDRLGKSDSERSCKAPNRASSIDGDAVVALTKCVVLEWSVDFDYQVYHHFPPTLILE